MAFTPISSSTIQPGDPITSDLFTKIKDNFDDHETRINALAVGSAAIDLINEDVYIGEGLTSTFTGALYIESFNACSITEIAIQLFEKGTASGTLTIDIKKNTSTNPSGFTSVLSVLPSLTMASASNYQRQTGTINASNQTLAVGDIIRLDLTSIPTNFRRFRIIVKAQL